MPGATERAGSAYRALLLTAFSALIAFGCVLRFWNLSGPGLWYDELWTVVGALNRPFMEMYREWILGDAHPPGYFFFYFAWLKLVPPTEFWARVPNAVAGAATVGYLLFGTRRVLSRDERIMTAALASLSYLYIFYAVSVKQYSAVLLFVTIATITYLEIVDARRIERRTGLVLGGSCVALAYLNHLAMVYAALLLALLVIALRRAPEARRRATIIAGAFALSYLPIAYFLYVQVRYNIDAWQPYQLQVFLADLGPSLFFDEPAFLTRSLVLLAAAVLVRMALDRRVRERLGADRNWHIVVVGGAFVAFMLALGVSKPIFYVRYFVAAMPAFFLALGIAMAAAFPIERGWLAVLPLAFFAHGAVVQFHSVDTLQREQWDKSVDLVLASRTPSDAIYVLGAATDRTEFDYLQAGDVDGVFNVRNLKFYRYYFRRRGAWAAAEKLDVVQPTVRSVRDLASRFHDTPSTIYVLAGHHVQYRGDALVALQQTARRMEITHLNATLVYKLTF